MKNAVVLGEALTKLGYTLVTGGTDTHLLLMNFKPQKLTGKHNIIDYLCLVALCSGRQRGVQF